VGFILKLAKLEFHLQCVGELEKLMLPSLLAIVELTSLLDLPKIAIQNIRQLHLTHASVTSSRQHFCECLFEWLALRQNCDFVLD
jgi:hypothetical protein